MLPLGFSPSKPRPKPVDRSAYQEKSEPKANRDGNDHDIILCGRKGKERRTKIKGGERVTKEDGRYRQTNWVDAHRGIEKTPKEEET